MAPPLLKASLDSEDFSVEQLRLPGASTVPDGLPHSPASVVPLFLWSAVSTGPYPMAAWDTYHCLYPSPPASHHSIHAPPPEQLRGGPGACPGPNSSILLSRQNSDFPSHPRTFSPPDGHRQYQDLLQGVALDLGIPLEEYPGPAPSATGHSPALWGQHTCLCPLTRPSSTPMGGLAHAGILCPNP